MTVKSGASLAVIFTTSDSTTGAAMDATGTPVGTLYVDGVVNGAGVTVTKPTGTGIYKAVVTLPTLTAGQVVMIYVTATVNAVAGAGIIFGDVADTKRVSDLVDAAAAPTVGENADAVWNEARSGHTTTGTYGKVSEWTSALAGAGSETVTITCLDSTSNAVEGVAVWVTSDIAGTTVVAGTLYSNSSGQVVVYLDVGTAYVWRQGGQNWTNPQTITVTDA
jgi:hypothetical protein